MKHGMSKWFAPFALFAVWLTVVPVAAQTPDRDAPAAEADDANKAEAGTRFGEGIELAREGNYQAALSEFRAAYRLVPTYQVLYNIAQVQAHLGDYAAALGSYEQYIDLGADEIEAGRREEVRQQISKLRSRVGDLTVLVTLPNSEILVDDVDVGRSPLAGALRVSAGRRKVTVQNGGRSLTKYVEIAGQHATEVTFDLGPPPAEKAPGPDPASPKDKPAPSEASHRVAEATESRMHRVPWTAWGITGGLTGAAIVLGIVALTASDDLEGLLKQPTTRNELEDAAAETRGWAVATDVFVGGAVIAAGISAALTVLQLSEDGAVPSKQAALRPALIVGTGLAGLQLGGRF